jgi:hypothetical protein
MPVAYKIPLPENYSEEFDVQDLRGAKQTDVECPLECGVRYSLITPEAETAEMIAYYRDRIHVVIGACGQHPGKVVLNF